VKDVGGALRRGPEARQRLLEYEEPAEEKRYGKGRFAPFGGKGRRLAEVEEASSGRGLDEMD